MRKDICRKCLEDWGYTWSLFDEHRWQDGFIHCVGQKAIVIQVMDEEMSSRCPWVLEHIVLGQASLLQSPSDLIDGVRIDSMGQEDSP